MIFGDHQDTPLFSLSLNTTFNHSPSPTRALVNDLYERLRGPLRELSLRLARRTGDHRTPLDRIPNVLITTPESFDSMLCGRRHPEAGHVLAHVRAVVLDEIHLFHTNARGEQLRWLIERLRRLRRFAFEEGWTKGDSEVQTVALSATVADPERVAEAFLHSERRVLEVDGGRAIETVSVEAVTPSPEHALPVYLRNAEDGEKVLVFSNARKRVDELAAKLRAPLGELGYGVRAHHGSLSPREREKAERDVKRLRKIVVFSTSTLELGVDIGDIDLVVLDGPAPSTPSLLQRMGRGNRRTNKTRVMACTGAPEEVLIQSAMIEAARTGNLGPEEFGPNHAVARQQIASFLFQASRRSRPRSSVQTLLDACAGPIVAETLIDHLVRADELLDGPDGLRLGQDFTERTQYGLIHSNIESRPGTAVVDEGTGEKIASGVVFQGGTGLRIGGQMLKVRNWHDQVLEVRRTDNPNEALGAWSYRTSRWMRGAGQPHAVREYLGITENQCSLVTHSGKIFAFHWGGGRRKAVIELLRTRDSGVAEKVSVNEWCLILPVSTSSKPSWLIPPSIAALELEAGERLDQLETWLARPWANKTLPYPVRLDEVRGWLQLERELEWLADAEWNSVSDPDARFGLRLLAEKFS